MTAETQRVQHTPGPWHANTAADDRYNDTVTIREPVNGDLVAVTSGKANARLIAAAPDLLAALEIATGSHGGLNHSFDCGVTAGCVPSCPRGVALDAIRKARGEDN